MINTDLSNLPIIPEEYDTSQYKKVDYSSLNSEMTDIERRFINGLVRYYKPEKIIEIGVSRGSGTVNLLNAISDIPDSKLTSIDKGVYVYGNSDIPIGIDVDKVFPDLRKEKWRLIIGKDPSEVLESLGGKYDFAVIDTAHVHPIESLNFLCLLPYLSDGAIVILHDVALHLQGANFLYNYATRILMSTVVGQKLTHTANDGSIPNIIAFQISPDTKRYIDNVFDSLLIPWGLFFQEIYSVGKLFEKHYASQQVKKYYEAVRLNRIWTVSGNTTYQEDAAKKHG